MQFTIREMKAQATSPRFWAGLLGIVCILTVSAPFATAEQFNVIQRFFYWGGIAVSTYFCAIFVLLFVERKLVQRGKYTITARIIATLVASLAVSTVVFFINTVVVGIDELHWKALMFLWINCTLITFAISAIVFIVTDALYKETTPGPKNGQTPDTSSAFYQRLPKSLGTEVISLQAQDHYVDVKTTEGNELILIRLSDAINELGEAEGIQVHRSWWVTHKHVVEQKRINNKPHLILSDGNAIPISRTYSADVKAALGKNESRSEN